MNNGKWICLLTLVLLTVFVVTVSADETLDAKIIDKICQYYKIDTEDINIQLEIRKNRIDNIPAEYDSISVKPMTRKQPRGLIPIMVDFYKNQDKIESGQVRIDIRYFQNVLVTTDRIKRNHRIDVNQLRQERRDVTYINDQPIVDLYTVANVWTKRAIAINQVLTSDMVELIPDVTPGDEVTVIYQLSGLDIRTKGVALENGRIGDEIRVRNNDSKKIIACTVLDDGSVQVESN